MRSWQTGAARYGRRFLTRRPSLSKSRFVSGAQCHLRLWYDTYDRPLAAEPGDTLRAVFATGHEVGEMACHRYPDGHLVAHDYRHTADALAETRRLIEGGTATVLFEPAFVHQGVLVRVDVLERLTGGGWRLVEVKSTTRLKDVFVLDAAVQFWVLRGAGLDVREAGVLTLNGYYVYEGAEYDLDALFTLHLVTAEANTLLEANAAHERFEVDGGSWETASLQPYERESRHGIEDIADGCIGRSREDANGHRRRPNCSMASATTCLKTTQTA